MLRNPAVLEAEMFARGLVVATVAVLAVGCTPKKIPGTELDDTDDTRAILDVMEKYRVALEKRDAQSIIGLAHESFKDDGGSANPDDDYDYHDLYTKLPDTLKRLGDIRLEFNVRKIELSEDSESARATYTYTASYNLPGLQQKKQSDTEIKQMIFKRVDKLTWKIVSGV
jgi:hypothetical protein